MPQNPLRAIVLRLNNDAAHAAVERVMQAFPVAYAVSIGMRERRYGGLPADAQRWINSSDARGGAYHGVDMDRLLPLDEELIESMRGCEAIFLHMVSRLEFARRFTFDERKRMYYRHLRVWNDLIERQGISLLLSGIIPHEIPDYLIYCLCKRKGIPTLLFHATQIRDHAILMDDWETNGIAVKERYEELEREFTGKPLAEIPLSPTFDKYFREQSDPAGRPPIQFKRPTVFDRLFTAAKKQGARAATGFARWLPSLISAAAWKRRAQKAALWREMRRLRNFYAGHAVRPAFASVGATVGKPDLTQPFVYVPLHFQPECSTAPMAGAFVDQLAEVALLSSTAPPGVLLYVKEHPRQHEKGIACRSVGFYESLLAMPNVRLIAHDVSSFQLREHCSAVATGTGTAGFEALFREKPVLMFGHHYFQYAPGVFRIRTFEDCRAAMDAIFVRGEKPDLRSVKLYLKAIEDVAVHASVTDWHQWQASDLTKEENTAAIAGALVEWIGKLETMP